MAARVYKTLGELRSKLLSRIGFGGLGAAAGAFVPQADDILAEANEQCWILMTDEQRIQEWTGTFGVGQRWVDIPNNCDPERIRYVEVYWMNRWFRLEKGITPVHDSFYSDITTRPYRYDVRWNPDAASPKPQLEFWPYINEAYPWKIEGEMQLDAFTQDSDYCSCDYRLLLMYAIAVAKAQLKRPDAQVAMNAWNLRKRALKSEQHNDQIYVRRNPNDEADSNVIPPPKVV